MIAVKAKYLQGLREMDYYCFAEEVKKRSKKGLPNSRIQDVFVSNKILRYRLHDIIEYICGRETGGRACLSLQVERIKTAWHNVFQESKIERVCLDFKSDLSGLTTRTRRSTELDLVEPLKN